MSLTSSLLIGRSALNASQVALQVTGNNIANAATPGYSRQRILLDPMSGSQLRTGVFLGNGVGVEAVRRVVNPALVSRLRSSLAQEAAANVEVNISQTIQALTNELTDADLSSQLTSLFNAFSELANNPASSATRASVIQQGQSLANFARNLRSDLLGERERIETELRANVDRVDGLLGEIAQLNQAITDSEVGQGEDGSLRDQRDALIDELASLADVTVTQRENGSVDVLIDSVPVVLGSVSRGLQVEERMIAGELRLRVKTIQDEESLNITSGTIGALIEQRNVALEATLEDLDDVVSQLIFQVNRLHTSGRPEGRLTSLLGNLAVPVADQTVALNDPANTTFADMPFYAENGSFTVVVHDQNGGSSEHEIVIDLNGVDAGSQTTANDTSLADIVADLNAIPNLNASLTPGGELQLTTDAGYDVSFQDDSSGVLAVLGINTFFEGTSASDVGVRQELLDDPTMLVVGDGAGGNHVANGIAGLRDLRLDAFNDTSLSDRWLETVERNAVKARGAITRFESLSSVRQSLEAQEAALSGVSLDEESVNLITYQQQYSGAARFVSLVNDLTNTLISLV
jgi:flagellar hook-associated protein 1